MTKLKKSLLKSNYYYEINPWYDKCPDILPEVPYQTEIFKETLSHSEIIKTYNILPYDSYEEAAAVCLSLIPDLKSFDP